MACDGASGEVGYIQLFRSGTLHLSLHLLAGQTLSLKREKQGCCNLLQVVFIAQKETLLEGAELLSGLPRGVVHREWEHGSSKLVPLNLQRSLLVSHCSSSKSPAYCLLCIIAGKKSNVRPKKMMAAYSINH